MDTLRTHARQAAYWLAVLCALWTTAFFWTFGTRKGHAWFNEIAKPIEKKYSLREDVGACYMGFIAPVLAVGTLCLVLVTDSPLTPANRMPWLFRPIQVLRTFGGNKRNQFGKGETNFTLLFFIFACFPLLTLVMTLIDAQVLAPQPFPMSTRLKWTVAAIFFGIVASIAMSFFLIPVARHSILLTAMGWSPVHALRFHVLSGYFAFFLAMIHGVIMIAIMLIYGEGNIVSQVIPHAECWNWNVDEPEVFVHGQVARNPCDYKWWMLTGLLVGLFFIILIVTSINWFRRRYYRAFYLCHVIFGALFLIMGIMHCKNLVYFMAPSLLYYFASTSPFVIQALASRLRGGVRIANVTSIANSGGCIEIQMAASAATSAQLDKEVSMYVKLCTPSISVVWHPFTVYKHPDDATTARFLIRPVGPFTKTLTARLLDERRPRPVTLLDGLYRGGDRIHEALTHDVVTIVCGGVAITPFLSMIPVLLQAVRASPTEPTTTKKLVVHWACREEGLASFVIEHYLKTFEHMAAEINRDDNFDFQVIVYHTSPEASGEVSADRDDTNDTKAATAPVHVDIMQGHDMELARFMPAVNSKFVANIPHVLMIGGASWVGFLHTNYYLNNHEFKVLKPVANIFSTLLSVVTSIILAIFFETLYMGLDKHFPVQPETYTKSIYSDPKANDALESAHDGQCIEHCFHRPSAADILASLESSQCPGIFMCGPPGLTEMVKREARKENFIGLTRYVLYEEPFEM